MGATAAIAMAVLLAEPRKRGKGRPRKELGIGVIVDGNTKRPAGRPRGSRKYSDEDTRWLLDRVEQRRAEAAKAGRNLSDAQALRIDLIAHFQTQGCSHMRAEGMAKRRLSALKMLLSRVIRSRG